MAQHLQTCGPVTCGPAQNISFDPTQMQAVMNNYNASSPEMEQMQQMGINPAEVRHDWLSTTRCRTTVFVYR